MAIALADSDALAFGITSAGVVYNFPLGAPGANDWDFICINSDATLNTPAGGWTLLRSEINNQGAYIFARKGGAGSSVTLTSIQSPGPFNATLNWSRWTGGNAIDVTTGTQAIGAGNTTPAVSTGTLAQTGEMVLAFGALHSIGTGNQSTPVWSTGFTGMEFVIRGTLGAGCIATTGYKLNAGVAAETPTVSWSGDGAAHRYTLIATLTATSDVITPDGITDTVTFGAPALSSPTVDPDGLANPLLLGAPTVDTPAQPTLLDPLSELYTQALGCLCAITHAMPGAPLHCAPRVGPEITYDMGQWTDYCCEGLAYISLGDTWVSDNSFPDQDIIRQVRGNCPPGFWAQDLKLGIIRCSPVGSEDGEPPTDADWTAAATQNLYDAQALRRVACCIRDFVTSATGMYTGMSVVINRQVQVTPNGGCTERYVTITVQFPNIDCIC